MAYGNPPDDNAQPNSGMTLGPPGMPQPDEEEDFERRNEDSETDRSSDSPDSLSDDQPSITSGVANEKSRERIVELQTFMSLTYDEQNRQINKALKSLAKTTGNINEGLEIIIIKKALMEARHVVESFSPLNLTNQLRKFFAALGKESWLLQGEHSSPTDKHLENRKSHMPIYRCDFFHTNHISALRSEDKRFRMEVSEDGHLRTTIGYNGQTGWLGELHRPTIRSPETIWNKFDEKKLRNLLNMVKKETSYENLFGWDLFCATTYFAEWLLRPAAHPASLITIFLPITALAFYGAVCAAMIIPSLFLGLAEYCFISPVVRKMEADKHAEFISTCKDLFERCPAAQAEPLNPMSVESRRKNKSKPKAEHTELTEAEMKFIRSMGMGITGEDGHTPRFKTEEELDRTLKAMGYTLPELPEESPPPAPLLLVP